MLYGIRRRQGGHHQNSRTRAFIIISAIIVSLAFLLQQNSSFIGVGTATPTTPAVGSQDQDFVLEEKETKAEGKTSSFLTCSEEECSAVCEAQHHQLTEALNEALSTASKNITQSSPEKTQSPPLALDQRQEECREEVFRTQGQGGGGEISLHKIQQYCTNPLVFDVCEDLKKFTGLKEEELNKRMMRKGRFHFEGEHAFWNPQSRSELAWYYATSVDYLFANSVHDVNTKKINAVATKEFEPVLEYSGGVGNNVLYIAKKGIKVHYFGIGLMEYSFARYRVMKHGVEEFVEFKLPFSSSTDYDFDPINAPLPQDGSLGSIIAMDVLEHIPDYHIVVKAMVKSIRVGGRIVESSPFARDAIIGEEEDLRVHLSNNGISMTEAMGPKMKYTNGYWEKIVD